VEEPVNLGESIASIIEDAQKRQASPGAYYLLHANGMKWADVVALISGDAVIVSEVERG